MISRFFIDRPIFAAVISIIIVLAGGISMISLPISQYPNIIPPQVVVSAMYPGASAEVISNTVASPLEQQINGVNNMIYMKSSSTNSGQMNLAITFEIGTDPDQATIDVNNAVQAALSRLPQEVSRQGIIVSKQAASILQVITMSSPDNHYDSLFVSNYALLNVIDELKRVPGIGSASIFGAKDYSMRIWLKPDKLLQYNLTPIDIFSAIREQNSQFAAGQFGQQPINSPQSFTYTISTQGRFISPQEFENIILRSNNNGEKLLLKDVARVELGAQDYSFNATYNGKPAIAIGTYLQPGANALATTAAIRDKMLELSKNFPEGLVYDLPFDTSKFVKISIHEVIKTFIEAILLVAIVVYIFLQNIRATIIPLIAVPVSLIGTFAGMYLFGFSINMLTLFGMVLSIGIVVDDTIVVLENVERIMTSEKISAKEATIKAMKEVSSPIIAIVLVLCSVFLPVGFIGGITGEMYKQFAVTIAVSVTISGVVALTLAPALCALLLKPVQHQPLKIFIIFNQWFEKITYKYTNTVKFILKRSTLGVIIFSGFIVINTILYMNIPTSLVPDEDQGYVIAVSMLLPGASLNRTETVTEELTKTILNQPQVENVVTFSGFDLFSMSSKSSSGASFVILKDWSQRKNIADDSANLAKKFMGIASSIKEAFILVLNPPPISGMSTTGGFEMYLQNRSGADIKSIAMSAAKIIEESKKQPELANVQTTLAVNIPQYYVDLDREKAKALNISIHDIFSTMQSTFGSMYVNDFSLFGRTYKVTMQSESEFREKPEDLKHTYVRSLDGNMISLDSLVKIKRIIGPDIVERFNIFPAAKIMGSPAPGYSSGQAIEAMEKIVERVLSNDYTVGWTGSAYQEKTMVGRGNIAGIFGIIMVFLILAAQYERWSLPLAVISAVPFAVFGSLFAVWMRGLSNDIYFQIGLITLVGLAAKNAILIIEFALLEYQSGVSIEKAAIQAARLRFRPIIMTSLAFIFGCVPLVLSSGAGAGSRHSIGTGVIGGMLGATFLAILFIPLFFKLLSKHEKK